MNTAARSLPARRPRVGVDFHTFDGIYQGSRSHLLGLYGAAIRQAPDLDFYFFLAHPAALLAARADFLRDNVHLIEMPHRPGVWRLLWQLRALQRRYTLDLLHVQYRVPLLPGGRLMCTIHDVLFETHPEYFGKSFARMARLSSRHAVRRADVLLTVSDYSRRQIARHYDVDPRRVVLTPNAVDRTRFHPSNGTTDDGLTLDRWQLSAGGYLCMLGRLEPRKNHVKLLEAYARLGASAPPLLIIGQRDFAYAQVYALIDQLGLRERVHILEDVDDVSLPVLLRHARLMLYPSHAEGFGMPVLESLASGVPVITGDDTSLPEVAGPAAWLVPSGAVDRIADALREALQEPPAHRERRIAQGLEHAARFNWHDSAANLLSAVRAALRDS